MSFEKDIFRNLNDRGDTPTVANVADILKRGTKSSLRLSGTNVDG